MGWGGVGEGGGGEGRTAGTCKIVEPKLLALGTVQPSPCHQHLRGLHRLLPMLAQQLVSQKRQVEMRVRALIERNELAPIQPISGDQ